MPFFKSRLKPEFLFDALTLAVVAVDEELNVIALNTAGEALFSVGRKNALGEPVAQAIPHLASQVAQLQRGVQRNAGFIERELALSRNGEPPITVDLTVSPYVDGKLRGLLLELVPLDRHLRISRDEMLSAQHQASRAMIRGLAHEIKNPLGGIRGAAQLLEREFPDSQHREYTQVIIREADRLQNLVNRLLGPNRPPTRSSINLHEVVEHVRQLVQAEAGVRVQVIRDYDPSIPDIVGDREQLIQAVLNLARNAIQVLTQSAPVADATLVLRTRTKRQFTIHGTRHRLLAQLDVEDNGPGIPPELIEQIFYPMVTTRAEGTGLGLPIAQTLIHSHGGLIECQSRPGRTVFSVFLPFETAKS